MFGGEQSAAMRNCKAESKNRSVRTWLRNKEIGLPADTIEAHTRGERKVDPDGMVNLRHVGGEKERAHINPALAFTLSLEFARRHIVAALIILIIGSRGAKGLSIDGKLGESIYSSALITSQ